MTIYKKLEFTTWREFKEVPLGAAYTILTQEGIVLVLCSVYKPVSPDLPVKYEPILKDGQVESVGKLVDQAVKLADKYKEKVLDAIKIDDLKMNSLDKELLKNDIYQLFGSLAKEIGLLKNV